MCSVSLRDACRNPLRSWESWRFPSGPITSGESRSPTLIRKTGLCGDSSESWADKFRKELLIKLQQTVWFQQTYKISLFNWSIWDFSYKYVHRHVNTCGIRFDVSLIHKTRRCDLLWCFLSPGVSLNVFPPCSWAQEFLNEENQGLDVLVDYLSFAHSAVT